MPCHEAFHRATGSGWRRWRGALDPRFGLLVYLLPLYHPIKLLDEICIDQISCGRLLLVMGCGISPIDLRYCGLNAEQTLATYMPTRCRSSWAA